MASSCHVHHELAGPHRAPAVVLSPSLGTDTSVWQALSDRLADRFAVVRYDLRGHGSSPVPPGPYAIADLGGDLLALLDRLEIQRAVLCGVSIGAMASLWVASHSPERVAALIACCTTARFARHVREEYRARAGSVRERGVEPIADGVLSRWLTAEFRLSHAETTARMRSALLATSREGYAGCCEALADMDLRPDLASITAPTLVIAAQQDQATPPEHGRLLAQGIAGARLRVMDGPHLAVVEGAQTVGDEISTFLKEAND